MGQAGINAQALETEQAAQQAHDALKALIPHVAATSTAMVVAMRTYTQATVRAANGYVRPGDRQDAAELALAAIEAVAALRAEAVAAFGLADRALVLTGDLAAAVRGAKPPDGTPRPH